MEQILTAVIAPFVIIMVGFIMVGFAVAIAFAPAVPNENRTGNRNKASPRSGQN
jgi:hypothetical protein